MRCRRLAAVVFAMLCVSGVAALAEVNEITMRACINYNMSANYRLDACAKLLAGQNLQPKERALILSARANIYVGMQDFEKALADLGEAIRLWPENATFQRARQAVIERQKTPGAQKNTSLEKFANKKV